MEAEDPANPSPLMRKNGAQMLTLKIAAQDGGFFTASRTIKAGKDILTAGDLVLWAPVRYQEIAKLPDPRMGWIGVVVAKIAPEIDLETDNFTILCRYDR